MLARIREFFCRHQWKATRFQALVPGRSEACTKCGKQRQVYPIR